MSNNNIVIIGSSGHSKVIIDIITKQSKYKIIGLIDNHKQSNEEVLGYPIIGNDDYLETLYEKENINKGIIAVGDNWSRYKIYKNIKKNLPNFEFISAIHPTAIIGNNVSIGNGSVVMAGTVINPDSIVGDHCIINTKSSIDHDCHISDFASIAPGVTTGGNVSIGKFSAISLGVNIIHKINIGENSLIGASSLVIKDIPGESVFIGNPCKFLRKRKKGEKYL